MQNKNANPLYEIIKVSLINGTITVQLVNKYINRKIQNTFQKLQLIQRSLEAEIQILNR